MSDYLLNFKPVKSKNILLKQKNKINIYFITKKTGLSTSTVSRALSRPEMVSDKNNITGQIKYKV